MLMQQIIPTIFHFKNGCRNNTHDSGMCSESFRTSSPFIYLLQLGNFTHIAHVPSGVKNHVGASSRKCSSVRGSSGHCLRGFSMMFHFFPTLGSGLNTASWSCFWGTWSSHTCSAVAWADPGGKQTVSTEGHPTLLTDASLKNRQGEKESLPKCF